MAQSMGERVAVFDVDGTLLRGDCLWLAARHSRGIVGQLLAALACLPWWIGWKLRLVSTGKFKQRVIAAFGVCEAVNRVETQAQPAWLLSELRAQLRPKALQRLRWHQQRRDRILLCSASPRPILQPLADWLEVELLCTELVQVQGQWRPKLASPNCKGPEKMRRLTEHLGPMEGLTIEAYGNSKGDRELLQGAAIPHYRSFGTDPRPYPAFSLGPLLPVVALALLGYGLLGVWVQGSQLLPLLSSLWPQIGLGMLLVLVGFVVRYGRWRLLLHAVQQSPPMRKDALIWLGSYAFTATPGKSGEAVRSLLLRQECNVPMPPTLMALVVERFTDGTAVLLLLAINLPLLMRLQVPMTIPISLGLLTMAAGVLMLRNPWAKALIKNSAKRLLPANLARAGGDGLSALRQLLDPMLLLQASVIAAVAWSLEGVSLWILLRGMGIDSASIGGCIAAHSAACLFGVLTLLPGGIGSTEAATAGLLTLQGVGLAPSTTAAILIRLLTLWFITVIGVGCLIFNEKGYSSQI